MHCAFPVCRPLAPDLLLCHPHPDAHRAAARTGGASRTSVDVVHSAALLLRLPLPPPTILAVPAQELDHCHSFSSVPCRPPARHLALRFEAAIWPNWNCIHPKLLVVGWYFLPLWLYRMRKLPRHMDGLLNGSLWGPVGVHKAFGCFWCHAMVSPFP